MNAIIQQLEDKMEFMRRQNAVLTNVLEAYQSGTIRGKEEVVDYVKAEPDAMGGIICLGVPEAYVGCKFRIVLEPE